MSFELRAVDRVKLYSSIIDQVVEGIRSGAFPPGGALPPERILATQLQVSRSSLREAIRVLEHSGVVDVRTGSGTYVTENGLTKAAMLRAQAALIGDHSPLDIVVARRAVELVAAEHAAIHRHDRDLELLQRNIDEQYEIGERGEDPEEVDLSFHLAVATASHNPVLITLIERVVEIMGQGTWRELKNRLRSKPGGAVDYLEHHRAILVAIEQQDGPGAASAMSAHLDVVELGLLAEVK